MKKLKTSAMPFLILTLMSLLGLFACHLTKEEEVTNTLNLTSLYDSLTRYDTVQIELRDPSGDLIDIVYRGHVDTLSELRGLVAPNWDGGKVDIVIQGYAAGSREPILRIEKTYNGASKQTEQSRTVRHPSPGLAAGNLVVQITEGQALDLPVVTVLPSDLTDKTLSWSSSNPSVISITDGRLQAMARGTAEVIATLAIDTARTLRFQVTVLANPAAADIISLDLDTLHLAEGGAAAGFDVNVSPASAVGDIQWTISDTNVAVHVGDGIFSGRKAGITRVRASSRSRAAIFDTAVIAVSAPVHPASVRFPLTSVDMFVGGAQLTLIVEVLPSRANQEVDLLLSDSSKASLAAMVLTSKAEGQVSVIARSRVNPALADTLAVRILPQAVPVQRVEVSRRSLTLYKGGPSASVEATVHPVTAPSQVVWTSLAPAVATVSGMGEIRPVAGGVASIVAMSLADSLRKDTVTVTVKVDAPRLTVGPDTTVSAGQPVRFTVSAAQQEFGEIVSFKWDLDGNQGFEDTARGLQAVTFTYANPGEYQAVFYVRDTEGNEVKASRKVVVAKSALIAILSPLDNTYTNSPIIEVKWSVDGKEQISSDTLKNHGANTVSRSGKDAAGKAYSASVTVHLDTISPAMPRVAGPSPTNVQPRWTWSTGGGGAGEYRFRLGDGDFTASTPTTRDTAFTLVEPAVSGRTYTLFVQERDLAGNWSLKASFPIVYDVTKPVISILTPQASGTHYTRSATVSLTGTASGPLPITRVTYKVGSSPAASATLSSGNWSTSAISLQEGVSVLVTITATDNAGNTGEAVLTLLHDATAPSAPVLGQTPPSLIIYTTASFGWSAGSDGTGSGLNGSFRFSLNNGPWKDTTVNLLTNITLSHGDNVFAVQEQDRAGNWSNSATHLVKVDPVPPTLTLTSHPNPATLASLLVTLSGAVRDSISSVSSVTISGQVSGSGTATLSGTSWTTGQLSLKAGTNILVATAADAAGNSRELTIQILVDLPADRVIITSPADNNTLTTSDSWTVHYTIDGVAGSKVFALSEGMNQLIVSSEPNASGAIGRDTVVVRRDATAPNAPTLSVGASPTRGNGTWSWNSNGDIAGGGGLRNPASYRYSLDAGVTWTNTSSTSHSVTTVGTHDLIVQEQDRAGNWSSSSTVRTIVIDRTAPVVAITSPEGGFVTSRSEITISYTEKDGDNVSVPKTTTKALPSDGQNTVTVESVADAAGNVGSASITIWRRGNVIFVRSGATGDGSSWNSPLGTLQAALAIASSSARKQIWLSNGTYKTPSTRGFVVSDGIAIYGGFPTVGMPHSLTQRDSAAPYRTILSASTRRDTVLNVHSGSGSFRDVTLNSLRFEGPSQIGIHMSFVDNYLIANCDISGFSGEEFERHPAVFLMGTGKVSNSSFHHNLGFSPVLWVGEMNSTSGLGINVEDCVFSDNAISSPSIYMTDGDMVFIRTRLLDYPSDGIQVGSNSPFPSESMTFRNCTIRGGRDAIFHGGTLNYDGSNNSI